MTIPPRTRSTDPWTSHNFKLGQRVRITDYLIRALITSDALLSIWPPQGEGLERLFRDAELNVGPREWRSYKVWLPQRAILANPYTRGVSLDDRYNPAPNAGSLDLPLDGIIVQKITISDGRVIRSEWESPAYNQLATRHAYVVAYNLHRRPITVLPEMIQEVEQ